MSTTWTPWLAALLVAACSGTLETAEGTAFVCPDDVSPDDQVVARCLQQNGATTNTPVDIVSPGCAEAATLIQTRCALGSCHGDGSFAPDFAGDFQDGRLVNGNSRSISCSPRFFIDQAMPAESSILQKISMERPCGGTGSRMPPPFNAVGSAPLEAGEVQCLTEWVMALAGMALAGPQ